VSETSQCDIDFGRSFNHLLHMLFPSQFPVKDNAQDFYRRSRFDDLIVHSDLSLALFLLVSRQMNQLGLLRREA
jgi:hypothetical protein